MAIPQRLNRALILCLLMLALTLSAPIRAEQPLTPYSAVYKVKISVLSGRLRTDLRATEDGFEAVHVIRPSGLAKMIRNGVISEQSHFSATGDGVKASWYQSEDTLSKEATSAEVSFDWSSNELSGTVNDEDVHMILESLVHDRVAIQYQLMYDMLNGGPDERYILFDIDEFKTLIVSNVGEKEVRTPAGNFIAVGIQHQAEHSSRVTTLWCVEELGYLPVLIEQHRKGKLRLRAVLNDYTPLTT